MTKGFAETLTYYDEKTR